MVTIILITLSNNITRNNKETLDSKNLNSTSVVLLTYHEIRTESLDRGDWQFYRLLDDFEKDLKLIKSSGVKVINYRDLIDVLERGDEIFGPHIIIQFDDGYNSDYDYVFPLLVENQMKATFFITPGRASNPNFHNRFMSWEKIRTIKEYENDEGIKLFEIGAHGQTHTSLDRKENESHEEWLNRLRYEFYQPKKAIKENLGIDVNIFALPFGSGFGLNEVITIAKEYDYELVRGWKTDDNNFINYETNFVRFFPVYNNSNIQDAIDLALGRN
jgi:peptidoglycan/xylan/chitin deacetylase (PgdA/CDA1 family)